MVGTSQVSPEDQVDSVQDHRVILVLQKFGLVERKVDVVAQKVVPVADRFSPRHPVEREVD